MKTLLVSILLCFILHSYAQDSVVQNGYQKFYYPNGNQSSEGSMRDGKPDGYWKTYYENGLIKSEGNRKDFQLDSLWKFYDSKGNLSVMITYEKGIKNGPRTTFFEDKKRVEYFENNKKNGPSKEYYPSGKLREIVPYSKGLEDGYAITYAEDGRIIQWIEYQKGYMKKREFINNLDAAGKKYGIWKEFWPGKKFIPKSEIPYRNGIIDGYAKYYDQKGNIESIEKYVNGVRIVDPPELAEYELRTDYYPDGNIKVVGSYKDGVAEGVRREYAPDGSIKAGYIMHKGRIIGKGLIDENGMYQGDWEEYYLSGRLQAKGKYKNSVKVGEWVYYFENGEIEQTGSYDDKGLSKGKWKWYYPNGTLRRIENFYDGLAQGHMTEYASDSTVMVDGDYVDGGFWKENVHGYRTEGEYLDDVREGEWKSYYPNGIVFTEGKYIDDFPDGEHIWYYENGNIQKKGSYIMGLKQGVWKYFDEEGKLFVLVEYDRGVEISYDTRKIEPELDPSELTQ